MSRLEPIDSTTVMAMARVFFRRTLVQTFALLLSVVALSACSLEKSATAVVTPPVVASPTPPPLSPPVSPPVAPVPPPAPPPTAPSAPPPAVVYSSALVITKGGTYSGNWQSLDASVPAIEIRTAEPVVIQNSRIRSLGAGIQSFTRDAQITVQNVTAEAVYPSVERAKKAEFVNIGLFKSVRIENNSVTGYATGVRLLNFDVDITRAGQVVRVRFNRFKNMDGRMSDGAGGYLLEHKGSGQAIGLNTIRNADVEIAWNEIINLPFQSQTEDVISTYESGGTVAKPILIHDNYVQGNYASNPAGAIDFSGCGINLGDSPSTHPDVAYTNAYNNQVVSFQNSGMCITAGRYQRMWNNRVVSSSYAPDGTLLGSSWRSGYNYNNYYNSPNWANNALYDNAYIVADRNLQTQPNYTPSGTPEEVYNNTELFARAPTTADEQVEFTRWQQKVAANNITLGVR